MLIIGIAGGTGSGKTTVVRKVMEFFPQQEVSIIPLDAYYKDNSHVPEDQRKEINFDHPDSIEFDLLLQHVKELKMGNTIQVPTYSYLTCSRLEKTIPTRPTGVVILEGILLFTSKAIRNLCDIKIYVDAPADDRLIRVISRDIAERGRDVREVLDRYLKTVKPMHEQFIEPTKKYADIIIPQGGENHVAIDVLASMIHMKLDKARRHA